MYYFMISSNITILELGMDRVRLRRATFELSGVLLGCPLRVPEDREELGEEDQDGRGD